MEPFISIHSGMTDEQLSFIREMGIEAVELNAAEAECRFVALTEIIERLSRFHLHVCILTVPSLQKNAVIHLNLHKKDGYAVSREDEIEKFRSMIRCAGACGIPTVSVAWQPTGIKRSQRAVGLHTRGGVSFLCDYTQLQNLPYDYPCWYGEEEVWENFSYFLERVTPDCVESQVRLALHPNDPPVPSLCGVASLIWNSDSYRRAFALDGAGILGMKLCVGCWLEGGGRFGNLAEDIHEFQTAGRIACVHFRNVDAPLPRFEETLAEDGYGDMVEIMRELVISGYDGPISIDHSFQGYASTGGALGSAAYPTGYMKGMLHVMEAIYGQK